MSYSVQMAVSAFASLAMGDTEESETTLQAMPREHLEELSADLLSFAKSVRQHAKSGRSRSRSA